MVNMKKIDSLPFREIHLDFHTSGLIQNIASNFNKKDFGDTLEKAHINSICCFALCHHGWLYYNSKKFSHYVHPNLVNKNLLMEQVDECHRRNIRVPIYITVMWNEQIAKEHPEWLKRDREGNVVNLNSPIGFYNELCVNTAYRDFLKELTTDVIKEFDQKLDGLFFDIVKKGPCYCKNCLTQMKDSGIDLDDKNSVINFNRDIISDFTLDMSAYILTLCTDISIYYNAGCVEPGNRKSLPAFSHLEFDALPSGSVKGYKKMLIRSRFDRTLELDYVGQTARFYTRWADFGTYKSVAALQYECSKLLSYGAKCLIGDQLLPDGTLDKTAYALIGKAYEMVEHLEPWCENVKPVTEIGLFSTDGFLEDANLSMVAAVMLERLSYQFDIVDEFSDFSKYALLLLPDFITLTDQLQKKISQFIASGGKIMATFESGLNIAKDKVILKELGIKLQKNPLLTKTGQLARGRVYSRNEYADYILCKDELSEGVYKIPQCMYVKGTQVNLTKGKILANVVEPLFYRTGEHFCSHRQAPVSNTIKDPAIVKNGNTIYCSHPMFTIYQHFAPHWVEKIMQNCIDLLIERIITHNGPKFLQTTLNKQGQKNRYALHLLNYITTNIAVNLASVEEAFETQNVTISLKVLENIKNITTTDGKKIAFTQLEGKVQFIVDSIIGHKILVIEY